MKLDKSDAATILVALEALKQALANVSAEGWASLKDSIYFSKLLWGKEEAKLPTVESINDLMQRLIKKDYPLPGCVLTDIVYDDDLSVSEGMTVEDLLDEGGLFLDSASANCAVVFRVADDTRWWVMTTEAIVNEANLAFVRDQMSQELQRCEEAALEASGLFPDLDLNEEFPLEALNADTRDEVKAEMIGVNKWLQELAELDKLIEAKSKKE